MCEGLFAGVRGQGAGVGLLAGGLAEQRLAVDEGEFVVVDVDQDLGVPEQPVEQRDEDVWEARLGDVDQVEGMGTDQVDGSGHKLTVVLDQNAVDGDAGWLEPVIVCLIRRGLRGWLGAWLLRRCCLRRWLELGAQRRPERAASASEVGADEGNAVDAGGVGTWTGGVSVWLSGPALFGMAATKAATKTGSIPIVLAVVFIHQGLIEASKDVGATQGVF